MKDFFRRRKLSRQGVCVDSSCATFTAGARSGVWTICTDGIDSNSIVYSIGVGNNLAWDLAIIERFDLTVHAFDPTPASIEWVRSQSLPPKLTFHPMGVAERDGTVTLTLGDSRSGINFRPLANTRKQDGVCIEAPVRRIETLHRELGHSRIDVLKLDIEGGEYAVLEDLLAGGLRPRQLLVEFHHHFPGIGLERTVESVRAIKSAGYAIFNMSSRGQEFSFIRAEAIS